MLRLTDELDRRIILGFCKKHQWSLKDACYEDKEDFSIKTDDLDVPFIEMADAKKSLEIAVKQI